MAPGPYKRSKYSLDTGEIPLIIEESTTMEPVESEPNGPSVDFFRQINDTARGHMVAMLAEFVGTVMFLFFSYAAAQIGNEKADTLRPLLVQPGPSLLQIVYISAVFGVSLGVNVWIFFRVSGGMFNPAVCPAKSGVVVGYFSFVAGFSCTMARRCFRLGPSRVCGANAISRCHRSSWLGVSIAAWKTAGRECSVVGCYHSPRSLLRDVSYCRAHHDYHHAGS